MDKRKIETNECSKARSVFEEKNDDQDEEIELSLGLSLNGKFGVDPKAKKIKRSSSIPEFIDPSRLEEKALGGGALVRACSLPAEGEDEMRKRKEVQMLRRKEAKRKRSEKQRNLKLSGQRSCEVAINKGDSNIRCGKPPLAPSPLSQGSVGSQGTGSSGITESENQSTPGVNKHAEARSRGSISIQSLKVNEQKREAAFANLVDNMCKFVEKARYKTSSTGKANNSDKELIKNFFRTMPFVSTKRDGSNGKSFDGFLYRYKKGEDVMIMCLCHGSLLTPAKFVNHAGGADVINPLRHIVVNPSPFL